MKSQAAVCFGRRAWREVAKERAYLAETGKLDFLIRPSYPHRWPGITGSMFNLHIKPHYEAGYRTQGRVRCEEL